MALLICRNAAACVPPGTVDGFRHPETSASDIPMTRTDRRHFLRAASAVMRHLLVDHARQREAAKRGSGLRAVTLTDAGPATEDDSVAVIALDDALKDLARIDPRLEQVMECRYFAGLSVGETAEALGMSERTVEREVLRARGYLRRALQADDG